MDVDEFRMAITHALAHKHGAGIDVAVLWRGASPVTLQLASTVIATDTGLALPIVRLLRSLETRPKKSFISTTAPPTEACLGMARMCGIDYIIYLKNGVLKKVTTGRRETSEVTVVMGPGAIPDVQQKVGTAFLAVPWKTQPALPLHGTLLRNWLGNGANSTSAYAPVCKAALELPAQQRPPASSFASSGLEYLGLRSLIGDQAVMDNVLMLLAWEMVGRVSGFQSSIGGVISAVPDARDPAFAGQNIGSLLADADGNIVAWGFNTNKLNPTRHGEINLISSYFLSEGVTSLPAGGTIYTTLEPCEMCSGAIHRTVRDGVDFRVLYGQKDENVFSTALQRRVKPGITMSASAAVLASDLMIKAGSGKGAVTALVDKVKAEQDTLILGAEKFKATTAFLKEQGTYKTFFAGARPQWWLYLWDYMVSKLPPPTSPPVPKPGDVRKDLQKELADPAVMRLNGQLEIIYMLVEEFMKTVVRQAKG